MFSNTKIIRSALLASACALAGFISAGGAQAGPYKVIANFHRQGSIGGSPTVDSVGNVYVTETGYYGAHTHGSLVEIAPGHPKKILHAFTGADGATPIGGVLANETNGEIFGTTCEGGAYDDGVLYELDPDGTYIVLHSFDGENDGYCPEDAPVRDSVTGAFYGVTGTKAGGHGHPHGTVWKQSLKGVFTVLHRFTGRDGAIPRARLIRGTRGELYGTTYEGGAHGSGTVFAISEGGDFTALHSFDGTDGAFPDGYLVPDSHGNVYGTTMAGGRWGYGNIFKLNQKGEGFRTIHSFSGDSNGGFPESGLLLLDNKLYGTTLEGGDANCDCGAIFEVGSDGSGYNVLHIFTGPPDGAGSIAGLARGPNRILYGDTDGVGGKHGGGTVFQIRR